MSGQQTITITADHLALARRMRLDWDDEIEWGMIGTDPKRPFGNSDVPGDVSEILGREVSYAEARQLTIELAAVLNAALSVGLNAADAGDIVKLPWRALRALR